MPSARPVVLGYYPDWSETLTPARIDMGLYTHICHAFVQVEKDGSLVLPDPKQTAALVKHAHAFGVKVLLSVGGESSNRRLTEATMTSADSKRLAARLADAVTKHGYDGLDIDWEAPENTGEQAQMNGFVAALRHALPHALLTMATPSTDWSGKWFDPATLAPLLDLVNIMAYDFAGPWSDRAGHNAALPDVAASVAYYAKKGWPREKLVLGIPLYGRGFRARKWGDPAKGNYPRSEVAYNGVLALVKAGWKKEFDTTAQIPYLVKPDGSEILSYEDAAAATRKVALAHREHLAGYFFWDITQDFDGKTNALVRASRKGWG